MRGHNQSCVSIRIERGHVNHAAGDAIAARSCANAADNAVTHSFAGVVHFDDFRRERCSGQQR